MRSVLLFLLFFVVASKAFAGTLCDKPYRQIIFSDTVNDCRKFALAGRSNAQYRLGMLYFFGDGTRDNMSKSVYWLTRAANSGNTKAQKFLAYIYSRGLGVLRRDDLARRWYEAAASRGDVEAAVARLKIDARDILRGRGTAPDISFSNRTRGWKTVFNTLTPHRTHQLAEFAQGFQDHWLNRLAAMFSRSVASLSQP